MVSRLPEVQVRARGHDRQGRQGLYDHHHQDEIARRRLTDRAPADASTGASAPLAVPPWFHRLQPFRPVESSDDSSPGSSDDAALESAAPISQALFRGLPPRRRREGGRREGAGHLSGADGGGAGRAGSGWDDPRSRSRADRSLRGSAGRRLLGADQLCRRDCGHRSDAAPECSLREHQHQGGDPRRPAGPSGDDAAVVPGATVRPRGAPGAPGGSAPPAPLHGAEAARAVRRRSGRAGVPVCPGRDRDHQRRSRVGRPRVCPVSGPGRALRSGCRSAPTGRRVLVPSTCQT